MTEAASSDLVLEDCSNLRQGDVIALPELVLTNGGDLERIPTPAGVVILSQTCDVVQRSKMRCLIAPVLVDPDASSLSSARKGQKPLHLYLESKAAEPERCLADMELAVSVPKADIVGAPLLARYVQEASSEQARSVAWRIGRAFSRFPFPDEVYPAFNKLRRQAQDKAGSEGNFGRVLDLVDDLRVSADQWRAAGRRLSLHVIVAEERFALPDDMDPSWTWGTERVTGLRPGETRSNLSLDRVSELILANLEGDRTTLAHLWQVLGETIESKLLAPALTDEVVSFKVSVVADSEMTVRQYVRTESLDLEVLSDSTVE